MVELNLNSISNKTFYTVNFGCRVNAAETNQFTQYLLNAGFSLDQNSPGLIFINTCSVTQKGNYESLSKIRQLRNKYPHALIVASGCADSDKIAQIPKVHLLNNKTKEKILNSLRSTYSKKIRDKFSHDQKFILKIQSGCTHGCSYCIVPQKRPYLWSLPPKETLVAINQAVLGGYQEVIITGINLNQYHYNFSKLICSILKNTEINLISFGSVPLNVIDDKFIALYQNPKFKHRLNHYLHIPLQSGSNRILKLMNRPYDQKLISTTFCKLKKIENISFGTDIIVGFPSESDLDFQKTHRLIKKIGLKKVHTFRFSPRPNTKAHQQFLISPKLDPQLIKKRSQIIRSVNT